MKCHQITAMNSEYMQWNKNKDVVIPPSNMVKLNIVNYPFPQLKSDHSRLSMTLFNALY